MAYAQIVRIEAIRSLGFASIGASYTAIGTPFTNQERIMFIDNLTDADLFFSFDGVVDHFIIPGPGYKDIDICTNEVADYDGFFTSRQTTIYVRTNGVAPTVKAVYVSAMYGKGGQ